MRKRFMRKLSATSLLGALLATFLLVVVQAELERQGTADSLNARLDRVVERIDRGDQEIAEITESIERDYIARARSVAIILAREPELMTSVPGLRALSERLDIDEIHIIDERGILVGGTDEIYFGLDFRTTEQTLPFMKILDGELTEFAQEPRIRGIGDELFQYVGVSREDGKRGIIQIGMRPERLEELLSTMDIDHALRGVLVGRAGYVFAVERETGRVSWHPDPAMIGQPFTVYDGFTQVDGRSVYAESTSTDVYDLVAVVPVGELYSGLVSYSVLSFCLVLLIFAAVAIIVGRFIDGEIVVSIQRKIETLNAVSGGDFSVRADTEGDTELARLGEGINFMIDHINHRYEEQAQLIEELRLAREMAEAASRAKTAFLENMGHEIRTPMNGVMGYIELALAEEKNPRSRDYLERIQLCATGLLEILNNILDVSQIEGQRLTLENVDFEMERVFSVCDQLMRPRFEGKGIAFSANAPVLDGYNLYGDPTRLRQVLLNLLSNAAKFTEQGRVEMSARLLDETEEYATFRFEVWDTGIGMSEDEMKHVFEPFTQGDDSATRRFGGTGLGLNITKSIVELMGGQLSATSGVGKGSMFVFTLRFEKAVPAPAKPEGEMPRPKFKGRVLVVEDNATNRLIIAGHLNKLGLRVVNAENGVEGITTLKRWAEAGDPFDVVLMDVQMPVMDGLTAARQLREEGFRLPIIALTASTTANDKQKSLDAGMTDFLGKPFTSRELWVCLLRYLTPIGEEPAQPVIDAPAMPLADGSSVLDRVRGVSYTAGDAEMYEQVLTDFYQDNKQAADDIEAAMRENRLADARRRAHTIKGNAGMIGAVALHASAAVLETEIADAINSGRSMAYEGLAARSLDAFRAKLNEVLELLAQTADMERKHKFRQSDAQVDKERAAAFAAQLAPLLAAGDASCAAMPDEVSRAFAGLPESLCETLVEQMDNYDFDEAAETLSKIREMIG